jgi:hypothetical protein
MGSDRSAEMPGGTHPAGSGRRSRTSSLSSARGLTTRIIGQILPCLDDPCTIHVTYATPELIADLERHREQRDSRIRCLSRNRGAISAYLDAVRDRRTAPGPASP